MNEQEEHKRRVGKGRNTLSFDPKTTLVRPDMRVIVGSPVGFSKSLKHDDVVIVPDFATREYDNALYVQLLDELNDLQKKRVKGAEYIEWHEGSHVISKNPGMSPTFQGLITKITKYFNINPKTIAVRFNWYRNEKDFKPAHHDSAAFNKDRAKNQNITATLSLGGTRELAFVHAVSKNKIYIPQTNGMLCSFGRDVNIKWLHAINAIAEDKQSDVGRISIVVWGMADNIIDEDDSPQMLAENSPRISRPIGNRVQHSYAYNEKKYQQHTQGDREPRQQHTQGDREPRQQHIQGDREPRQQHIQGYRPPRQQHTQGDRLPRQQHTQGDRLPRQHVPKGRPKNQRDHTQNTNKNRKQDGVTNKDTSIPEAN